MKATLLTINDVYLLTGAAMYFGTITMVKLFLVPNWGTLRPQTVHDQFTLPIAAATRFFKIFVPTWLLAALVIVVTDWGESTVWPASIALLGMLASGLLTTRVIFPVNNQINAESDPARLNALLARWIKLNDARWACVIVMWAGLCWYFVQKPDLPGALG